MKTSLTSIRSTFGQEFFQPPQPGLCKLNLCLAFTSDESQVILGDVSIRTSKRSYSVNNQFHQALSFLDGGGEAYR